jgi:hypothetical protein
MTDKQDTPIRKAGRKAKVGAAGAATVALGVVLLPLPGPGTLVILGGLTMLGKEFPVAQRLADKGWRSAGRLIGLYRRRTSPVGPSGESGSPEVRKPEL